MQKRPAYFLKKFKKSAFLHSDLLKAKPVHGSSGASESLTNQWPASASVIFNFNIQNQQHGKKCKDRP